MFICHPRKIDGSLHERMVSAMAGLSRPGVRGPRGVGSTDAYHSLQEQMKCWLR